ncbi:MAG: hypothetical protein IRZ05_12500, partial [Micromonosporaceae bacterium]|nr:hypothetical protein [Micromonosporaceae bacterium]
MLADAGGGGRVATPWFDYALPQIWQIVNGQDTEALWKQASGWKKTVELTTLHKYNLDQYKEQLAQAWPPGRSEAASAYLAELDKLITSVQETHDAASANYSAVVSIALALSDAKYKLKPLYEEYQENERKLAAYRQQVDAYNSDATAMPQPSPGPSPVKEGRQEELNNQARSIMYRIGNEITTAGAALKPPRPYQPPKPGLRDSDGGGDPSGGAGSAGGGAPLLVPPVVPPVRPAPSFDPPPANLQPVPTPSAPTGIGQGPILGGTPTTLPPPPPPTTTPQVIQP